MWMVYSRLFIFFFSSRRRHTRSDRDWSSDVCSSDLPLGQTLIVTSGCGWVQSEGQPKVEIRPGDVVWCPPNERHWHGATPTTAMTHIAIQEALDGKVVEWMEKVSDEQYLTASGAE